MQILWSLLDITWFFSRYQTASSITESWWMTPNHPLRFWEHQVTEQGLSRNFAYFLIYLLLSRENLGDYKRFLIISHPPDDNSFFFHVRTSGKSEAVGFPRRYRLNQCLPSPHFTLVLWIPPRGPRQQMKYFRLVGEVALCDFCLNIDVRESRNCFATNWPRIIRHHDVPKSRPERRGESSFVWDR